MWMKNDMHMKQGMHVLSVGIVVRRGIHDTLICVQIGSRISFGMNDNRCQGPYT